MRNVKKLKIYKSILMLGTSSVVLMTSCGKVSEVEQTNQYEVKEETVLNEKIGLDHVESENNQTDEYVITITDEFGNDVTDIYSNNESEINENSVVEDTTIESEQGVQENTSDNIDVSNDEVIISYFSEKKNDLINTTDLNEFKEKAIDLFITTVDFIFYDTEIYGIKYNDLKEETKKTILNDFAEIDSIISSKYPTYKEDVQAKYDKAANWTVESYNTVINYIKSGLSDESLNNIDVLKDSLKDTAGDLANTAEGIYNDQKVKVKDWYENYKNNH